MREWLKDIRKQTGLSTYAVAKKAGVSQSHYSAIENGVRGIPVHTAKKIAAALDFEWTKFYDTEAC